MGQHGQLPFHKGRLGLDVAVGLEAETSIGSYCSSPSERDGAWAQGR